MKIRSDKADLIDLSLLSVAIRQAAPTSHAIFTIDTVSEPLPEITVIAALACIGRMSPIERL